MARGRQPLIPSDWKLTSRPAQRTEQRLAPGTPNQEGDSLRIGDEYSAFGTLPNVSRLSQCRCGRGKTILTLNHEKGSPSLDLFGPTAYSFARNNHKAGDAYMTPPDGILKGDAGRRHSQGHALSSYPKARAFNPLIIFAAQDLKLLGRLTRISDAHHSALAAHVLVTRQQRRCGERLLTECPTDRDAQ